VALVASRQETGGRAGAGGMTAAGWGAPAGLLIRPLEERDARAVTVLLCEVDDARVLSPAGWRHRMRHHPERARVLELAAEVDGRLVGVEACGLNTWTTTPGACWASVNVTARYRRRGIGSLLLERALGHLRQLGGTRATSFFRASEEGERWAVARGWDRVLAGPLIALDPRSVPKPSPPPGFSCLSMAEFDRPQAIFEATRIAALDEPTAVRNDDIRYQDWLLTDWGDPDTDRGSSAVVLDGDRVVSFAYMRVAGVRGQHGFTGTLPDYRGRGLATVAKRHALRAAAAKGVTRVTTSNAEENASMRAINRRLGFEPIGEHAILGRDI
jgi:GNAT superfamily N-acetyltransferase